MRLRTFARAATMPLCGALVLFLAAHNSIHAQTEADRLENGPYSGGVIMAHLVATGKIAPAPANAAPALQSRLTCSPAPCGFPNSQASPGGQPANETPIAADPKNPLHLLSGANDYNCATLQGYYASTDGGSTWTRTCSVAETGLVGLGDPVVGYDLNGIAYRGGINGNNQSNPTTGVIVVSHSADHGATWSKPVTAVPSRLGGLADKPWLAIDTNPRSPHRNAIYVSATQFNSTGTTTQITVSRSGNGGATWTTTAVTAAQAVPTVNQFTDLAIGADGTVYLSWMRCTTGVSGNCANTIAKMLLSKSTDGGLTWSAPTTIGGAKLVPDNANCNGYYGCLPNTRERISDIPVIAIDTSTGATAGKLYVVDYTWTGAFTKVQVAASTDGGAKWGGLRRVASSAATKDQFFPWLSVSATGIVGITWLDRRNDPSNLSYEAFGAASKDGGATYPNRLLSAHSSNPNNDGFGGTFMGDYTGNSWAGGSLFAAWTDTSNGSSAQDVVGGLLP